MERVVELAVGNSGIISFRGAGTGYSDMYL